MATPIGNLGDITRRAVDVLGRADLIACEDTRVTLRLLAALGLAGPGTRRRLVRYDDHVADEAGPRLLDRIAVGASVALVSDAGTPAFADPGQRLIAAARTQGVAVTVLPGASAALAAALVSGLSCERVLFEGFLPQRSSARAKVLAELAPIPATLVIFEAPHRLPESLAAMAEALGAERPAAVVRELTKQHEEVRTGSLGDLAAVYAAEGPPKGEVVVVIGRGEAINDPAAAEAELDARLGEALARMSLRDAVAAVAAATGLPRRRVYARALALAPAPPPD